MKGKKMSVTIFEILENAEINFSNIGRCYLENPIYLIAISQLRNAIKQLRNGKEPDDIFDEDLMEE